MPLLFKFEEDEEVTVEGYMKYGKQDLRGLRKKVWIFAAFVMLFYVFILSGRIFADCNTDRPVKTSLYGFFWGSIALKGSQIERGDEIRAYADTNCVGYFKILYSDSYGFMALYEDDESTDNKDGLVYNDVVEFRLCHDGIEYECLQTYIWDSPEEVEFDLMCGDCEPRADFTASPRAGVFPLHVQFVNESTNAENYLWNFGDGNITAEKSPTYIYSLSGEYTIGLTAFNQCGKSFKTKNRYILVSEKLTADFNANPNSACEAPLQVKFINRSSDAESLLWEFGDGNTSTEISPTHVYRFFSKYTVALTIENTYGYTAQKVDYITIKEKPIAIFTANQNTMSRTLKVVFKDTSKKSPTIWLWDFGDGNNSAEQNPVHVYANPGTNNVILTVSNDICISKKAKKVNVIAITSPRGRILDQGKPGNGIEGVKIVIKGHVKYEVYTDENGYYALENLPVGDYVLYVSAFKYESEAVIFKNRIDKDAINDIYLKPISTYIGSISGYVFELEDQYVSSPGVDANRPIPGASVFAIAHEVSHKHEKSSMGMKPKDSIYKKAVTDSNGAFEIYIAKKAKYSLIANAKGYFPARDANQYLIDPEDPNTFKDGLKIALEAIPKGPKVRITSFEWEYPDSYENRTRILIFVDSDASYDDPNIEVGVIDLDSDGQYSDYDGSFIQISPFGILSIGGDINSAFDNLILRIDRLYAKETNTITAQYDIYLIDANGDRIRDYIVDEDNPIQISLEFDPNEYDKTLANLVVRYKSDDGDIWKTDGISNMSIENGYIKFDTTHLTYFAVFADGLPSNLTLDPIPFDKINLSWQDNLPDEWGFKIARCETSCNNADNFNEIAMIDYDITSFSDSDVAEGNHYFYRVYSFNRFGDTDYAEADINFIECPDPPSKPYNLFSETIADKEIKLTWSYGSDPNCATFEIFRTSIDDPNHPILSRINIAANTEYIDSEVKQYIKYTYQIRAYNDKGYSDFSDYKVSATIIPGIDSADKGGSSCFISIYYEK